MVQGINLLIVMLGSTISHGEQRNPDSKPWQMLLIWQSRYQVPDTSDRNWKYAFGLPEFDGGTRLSCDEIQCISICKYIELCPSMYELLLLGR